MVFADVATGNILSAYRRDVAVNRVVAPGSTVKPFILRELLVTGKADQQQRTVCPRRVTIGGRNFDCSHDPIHHAFSPEEALAYSCNWYFSTVGARLTPAELHEALLAGGVAAERSGSDTGTRQMEILGETVRTTPMRLLHAYRQLALQRRSGSRDAALEVVFAGLEGATRYGTARSAAAPGVSIAGKTGTANADEGAWTHGWFAGYSPSDRPSVAIVVYLERGHGSDAAAIAGRVLAELAGAQK